VRKPPIIPRSKFKSKNLRKSVPTYYVVEKVRGKFKKLYPKPLKLKDARDYAVYSIDNRLSKTAFFVPLGKSKKIVQAPKTIQGYYSKNARKVRPYRIKYGKKKQLVNGYIEKRKFFQDTTGEKSALRNLRRRSTKRKVVRRKRTTSSKPMRKRRVTQQQRKVMLRNLAKARRARMRNLRKRR